MPSVRYYNQTAPFWDWVASLEEQGSNHPFFANRGDNNDNNDRANQGPGQWPGFAWGGPFAYRGRHGPPPPPPAGGDVPPPPPPGEKDGEAGPSEPHGPPPPFTEKPEEGEEPGRPEPPHRGPGSHRGRCGGRGGAWARRGPWGGRGGHFPMGGPPFFGGLAEMFNEQLFGGEAARDGNKEENFKPDVDVFDAPEAFVVHVSLPGAKKEDVGVNWDAEKSELNIAGVVYRPGDEEFLKTLALDERKVGAFERKVRLGSRANPAQVDVDAITARMEDGVLRVEVPKLDSGYVEVKKVDIE